MMTTLWQSPITHGALSGALAAALVDLHAFRAWKTYQDALA